jgi:TetR/AcrR family transcriptional repressor of nem operon
MSLRDNIVQESMKLFSLKGFLSTSISDILEASHSSKGGFYNHFHSKEDLFLVVLAEAQRIWREKVLYAVRDIDNPTLRLKTILHNYRDRYLKDDENFPGGCVFVTFSVELDDQRPRLCAIVNDGYMRFKAMLKRLLEEARQTGELDALVDTDAVTELLFSGMLGASVIYGVDKSNASLDRSIDALIGYIEQLETGTVSLPG